MAEEKETKIPALKNIDPEYLRAIEKLRFIDDDFMVKIFENIPCTEFLLQHIMNREDLTVKSVQAQYDIKNLNGRSVRLDVFAVDKENKLYNIEIQRSNSGAVLKRARYNASLIDAHITNPGDDYKDLCDTYVIFITENDVFKKGLPVYHIEKVIQETGDFVDDGSHIMYVNSTVQDDTALGWIMHDFFCTDPNDMHYDIFARRAKYFKETEEGVRQVCQVMQDFLDKGVKKGEVAKAKDMAIKLADMGVSVEKIAKAADCDMKTVKGWLDKKESMNC